VFVLCCLATVKHKSRTPTSVPKSHGSAVRKTRRKKSESLRPSSGGLTSAKDVFSWVGNYTLLMFFIYLCVSNFKDLIRHRSVLSLELDVDFSFSKCENFALHSSQQPNKLPESDVLFVNIVLLLFSVSYIPTLETVTIQCSFQLWFYFAGKSPKFQI
jgi:hypothetical protein